MSWVPVPLVDLDAEIAAIGDVARDADVIVPVGGRTHWEVGGPPPMGTEVSAPVGIVEYDPAELTVTVGAGTTVADLDVGARRRGSAVSARSTSRRGHRGWCAGGRSLGRASTSLRPAPEPVARSALRHQRRPPHQGRRAHGEERQRIRRRPLDGGLIRYARRHRAGDDAVRAVASRIGMARLPTLGPRVTTCVPHRNVLSGTARDHSLGRGLRRRRGGGGCPSRRRGHDRPPAVAARSHRGRISIPPNALASAGPQLDDLGLTWLAEAGVGTIHVATDDAQALAGAAASRDTHDGWLLREAGAPELDGFGLTLPNSAVMSAYPRRARSTARVQPRPASDAT